MVGVVFDVKECGCMVDVGILVFMGDFCLLNGENMIIVDVVEIVFIFEGYC